MKSHATPESIRRRVFLRRTVLAAATVQIVPGRVLGLGGEAAPSNRLNIAGIGVGGQGGHDVSQFPNDNIVALCDVDWRHAAGTFKKFPQAQKFKDYREMLDKVKEIDAVVVGTPDHQHAFASMAAIRRGKHVYCEKPLTHSVWEARQVAEAARQARLSTQMGNQGQASEETRRLCEIVWSGAIGKVTEVHIWTDRPSRGLFDEYWPQGVRRPSDTPPVPADLDWDLWLGPAPMRPYHPIYAPFKWRGWWDFGTGALGDIGCHSFDPVFRALKLGAPTSVQASSSRVNEETFPLASMVTYQFPARPAEVQLNNFQVANLTGTDAGAIAMPPVKLVWYDGGLRPPRPADLEDDEVLGDNGRLLVGTEGYILGGRIYPEKRRIEVGRLEAKIPRVPQGAYAEWSACCKQNTRAGSHFDWAGPLAETVLLGNVGLRVQLREKLTRSQLLWDSAGFQFTNVPEANAFLRRTYREGWSLG
ncbi:MAG: Gfo/Idh/MocA family oxidoreductase [Verrucomicrobiales bacterium]|nr:Gfo/Idh/MocA family oxidoreductase [Verrucomicrobiales bacterium]